MTRSPSSRSRNRSPCAVSRSTREAGSSPTSVTWAGDHSNITVMSGLALRVRDSPLKTCTSAPSTSTFKTSTRVTSARRSSRGTPRTSTISSVSPRRASASAPIVPRLEIAGEVLPHVELQIRGLRPCGALPGRGVPVAPVDDDVPAQELGQAGMGLHGDHLPLRADQASGQEGEVADVGTDVHEDLTGPEFGLQPTRDMRFPQTVEDEPGGDHGVACVDDHLRPPPGGHQARCGHRDRRDRRGTGGGRRRSVAPRCRRDVGPGRRGRANDVPGRPPETGTGGAWADHSGVGRRPPGPEATGDAAMRWARAT